MHGHLDVKKNMFAITDSFTSNTHLMKQLYNVLNTTDNLLHCSLITNYSKR